MNSPTPEETNAWGEPLDASGGIVCNLDYWDCECETDYIHHVQCERCWRCGAEKEESPSSREEEVRALRR
jgi:hypothetical protein